MVTSVEVLSRFTLLGDSPSGVKRERALRKLGNHFNEPEQMELNFNINQKDKKADAPPLAKTMKCILFDIHINEKSDNH